MYSTPPESSPDLLPQILKIRPDWASGVASAAGRKELRVLWMALFGGRDLAVYLQCVSGIGW